MLMIKAFNVSNIVIDLKEKHEMWKKIGIFKLDIIIGIKL
jgi:hypothetical protein